MMRRLLQIYRSAKDILIPPLCFSCGRKMPGTGILCGKCREEIEFIHPPCCRFCCAPVNTDSTGLCRECRGKQYPYDRLVCAAAYKKPLVELIRLLKYKEYDYIGDFLGDLIVEHLSRINLSCLDCDIVAGVPLHPLKLKERGFNQTWFLAKKIANYFKLPVENDIIYVTKNKPSQTKLSGQKRRENITNAFSVTKDLKDKRIILVDDVFTSGATITECARALKNKGAGTVTAITLAKT